MKGEGSNIKGGTYFGAHLVEMPHESKKQMPLKFHKKKENDPIKAFRGRQEKKNM